MSRNPDETTDGHMGRRTFMKASAAAGVAGVATGQGSAGSASTYVIEQDGVEHEVTPLSYQNQTIEEFYGYREDRNTPHSYTPTGIERADTSALFLYEGPEGLSLVMLHDTYYDGGGGSVRFEFSGLPSDGTWAVKDDSGDSYTRTHADWWWVSNHTDGGAYRGLDLGAGVPFADDITLHDHDSGETVSLGYEWNYVERFDRGLEGLDGPVWVAVFTDNAPLSGDPGDPPRQFDIQDGEIVPTETNPDGGVDEYPADDVYLVLQPRSDGTTLKFAAVTSAHDHELRFRGDTLIPSTQDATDGATFDLPGVDTSPVTITPDFQSGISSWQVLSGDAANPDRIDLDLSKPVTIRSGSTDGDGSLIEKADTKQGIIDNIRQQNEDVPSPRSGGLLPPNEASSLDSRAQDLVDTVRTNLDDFTDEETTQYGRALDVVTATERAGLAATTKPIQVARKTSGFLIKTVVMYAVEKLGELGRLLDDAAESVSNLPGVRTVTDFVGNVADVVFGTVKRHVLNAISGSMLDTVIDTVARFVDRIQEYLEAAMGSKTIRELGKAAATKTIQAGVDQADDGVIGTLKDIVAEFQEELAGAIYEDYYLSELVLIAPLPGTQAIEQNIDDTAGIEIGPISLEPPNIDVPDPLEGLTELETIGAIQDTIDRFTPGGIDTTMDERAARAAAGASAGSITQDQVDVARTASGVTETVCRGICDTCLFVFDTVYGVVDKIVSTIETALIVGGLLAYVARKLATSLVGVILAAILEGTVLAVLTALGKAMLVLTALEVVLGSLVLRITANIHWMGTLAAVNPAYFPAGSDAA